MTSPPAGDAWYLPADDYWVRAEGADDHPVRQGDLFGSLEVDGQDWLAGQIVDPTCELSKPSVKAIQVVRVHHLDALPDERQRASVTTGYRESDQQIRPLSRAGRRDERLRDPTPEKRAHARCGTRSRAVLHSTPCRPPARATR